MLGWQQTANSLTLDDNVTLQINSGMILFANMGQGINQDMQSYINGGTIDFGNKEGIITNINGSTNPDEIQSLIRSGKLIQPGNK